MKRPRYASFRAPGSGSRRTRGGGRHTPVTVVARTPARDPAVISTGRGGGGSLFVTAMSSSLFSTKERCRLLFPNKSGF